jgi:DNA repair exonuclease SbcCD nuclease subunit
MRLGFTADLHLDKKLGPRTQGGVNLRSLDLERSLTAVIDGFIAARVDIAIVAGDVFDTPAPSERSRQVFASEIARLRSALPGARIVILRGNHDTRYSFTPGTAIGTAAINLPGVVVVDAFAPTRIDEDDFVLMCIPWMRSDAQLAEVLSSIRPIDGKPNILVMHAGIAELPEFASFQPGSQTVTRSMIPNGFRRIFAGHYHGHRTFPDLGWVSIGSPERISVAEVGQTKGWCLYETDTDRLTHHATPTRSWYDIGPLDAKTWTADRVLAEVRSIAASIPDWNEAIVRIRIEHLRPDVVAALNMPALRRIEASAFYASIDLRAATTTEGDAGPAMAEPPTFEDIVSAWHRFIARSDHPDPVRTAIDQVGAAVLSGATIGESIDRGGVAA